MGIYDTIIVGGGASGLMAAGLLGAKGLHVLLLEKQGRVGRKLLSTGNGRCNLTNMHIRKACYHGAVEVAASLLKAYPPTRVRDYFESVGLSTVEDAEGRVYPAGNLAAGVLDALRLYADEQGCQTLTDCPAEAIARTGDGFSVTTPKGSFTGRNVLVCTGGIAAPKLGGCADGYRLLEALGHTLTPRTPALAPLKTLPDAVRGLKGQRLQCTAALWDGQKCIRTEAGELLFDDAGISGIAAMQLSRACALLLNRQRRCTLHISVLPYETALAAVRLRRQRLPERALEDLLTGMVGKRIGLALMRAAGVSGMERRAQTLTGAECEALARALSDWQLPIVGVQGFERAQVTAGGVNLKDFDPRTLESARVPGLYTAGEVLDVDGDCGGFNLQWAWASAMAVSEAMIGKRGSHESGR